MGHQSQAQGVTALRTQQDAPTEPGGLLPPTTLADPTIVAIATPPAATGAVGIVRLSGTRALDVARQLCSTPERSFTPIPRRAHHVRMQHRGQVLDEALLLCFAAPHSYTGEDVVELQQHGSPLLLARTVEACLELLGESGRLAEPGEFTRRAFLNGKLDLAQAEAVADLIAAQTATSARLALRTLEGEFSRQVNWLSEAMQELRALVEATLDFSDEPVMSLAAADVLARLIPAQTRLEQLLLAGQAGMPYREGLRVVILGRPNVGKSSLLNAISGEELAIVSPVAGTTRDLVREHLQVDGVPITLLDTAGLRVTQEPVEREGIRRAMHAASQADVVLFVAEWPQGWTSEDEAQLARLPAAAHRVLVWNKRDLTESARAPHTAALPQDMVTVEVSAKTGAGVATLKRLMLQGLPAGQQGEAVYLVQQRHLHALRLALLHLQAAHTQTQQAWQTVPDLVAEELRLAHLQLMNITGAWGVEDLLGSIFSRFCIGK